MNSIVEGTQWQAIYDSKLASALLALGVKILEPVMLKAEQHPTGKDGGCFLYDPSQQIEEIETGEGPVTAGEARKRYESFDYCRENPAALTSILRFALESCQRVNKHFRSGNALVQTITPTGQTTRDGAKTFTADSVTVRQNWGDGNFLVPIKYGRSYYLVRKNER